MNTKLTLQEKLRDLRDERNLTLAELNKATGISISNLHRLEDNEEQRVGYQDVYILAKYYDVSTDYLFGLTDNRQYRGAGFDALHLSDEAIAELQSGNLNNRTLSELITHPDFAEMLSLMEVYVDRTLSDWFDLIHKAYDYAVEEDKEAFIAKGRDIELAAMKQLGEDPNEYLRFRLTGRFEDIVQSIYEEHKKDAPPNPNGGIVGTFGEAVRIYTHTNNKSGDARRAVAAVISRQLGIVYEGLPHYEKIAVATYFSRAKFADKKELKKRGNRKGF